jgi:hypothetical protein
MIRQQVVRDFLFKELGGYEVFCQLLFVLDIFTMKGCSTLRGK